MGEGLFVGKTVGNEKGKFERVFINSDERQTHMHVIGSTGTGKSKFLEHMIREDIIENNGLCLIDPHGYLYNDIVTWCETYEFFDTRKIVLFDPSEASWTFGFNPLGLSGPDLSFFVDAMVKAVAKVWGGEDTDKTPLLKRCLRIVFHALAEKKLSLLEAQYLTNPIENEVRKYLTRDIEDAIIRKQWQYFNILNPRQFYEEFGSTTNRMMEFLASPIIRSIVGQLQKTIDFRKIMDEGYILLVNLGASDRISDDNARLLGTLMVNDLFMKAKGRAKGSLPFYVYIDECARFVNEDIARILDEGRKFGLHLILAHQHLAQLRKAGEDVYHAIRTDAKTKVVFGGLNFEDAEVMVNDMQVGELDLEEWKEGLRKPTVVRYDRAWFESYAKSTGYATGGGATTSRGMAIHDGLSEITTRPGSPGLFKNDPTSIAAGKSRSSSSSYESATSDNWSSSENETSGKSEGLEPYIEWLPFTAYSKEEQVYRAIALMVNQPARHAIIKLPGKPTQTIKISEIKEGFAAPERVLEAKFKSYGLTDFVHERGLVELELKNRWKTLETAAEKAMAPRPEPDDFREEER